MIDAIRQKRLELSKEKLVDIIESLEEDGNDNETAIYSFFDKVPWDNNQILFEAFLDWTRDQAWDIPSALLSVCSHLDIDDVFMHRDNKYWGENDWSDIDKHFKEVHGLDLTSPSIDWTFST